MTIETDFEEIREFQSNMEKYARYPGSTSKASHTTRGSIAEDGRDRQFDGHLGKYCEGIILMI